MSLSPLMNSLSDTPMRRVILSFIVLALLALRAAATEAPNILWITCEDMGPHLGCYGDNYSVSPTIDALAARSMRYMNASSNAPVCAPARTTIISGLYAPSTGAEHMRSEVRMPAGFRMFPQFLRDAGYYCTNNHKEDYNLTKPGRVWDVSSQAAHWKNRGSGQPFFAVFNHGITHESQIRNKINAAHRNHDPAKVPVPPYHPDTPQVRRDWCQYYDRITMMDAEVAAQLRDLEEAGLAEDTIVFFFSDHGAGMPRNKRWLYGSGLHVPLIVYFPEKWRHLAPSDYRAGGASDRLVSFVDLAPTVLSLAGVKPPEWMQGGAFAGKFQTGEPQYSYGSRARMDERYDLVRSVRDKRFNYIRNYMPHRIYGQHVSYMFAMPTTGAWLRQFQAGKLNPAQAMFWQKKPPEELYDLQADPEEINNLAVSPAHREVLIRMRKAHHDWERQIKDVDLLPEWEMHERSHGTSPYEMGHDPSRYNFDAIFAAAQLASAGDAKNIPALRRLMKHEDSAERYWAAIGLLAQEDAGVKAGQEELVAALADESPMVRIVAAEALGRFGSEADAASALDILLQYLQPNGNYYLAVAAWNALDELDQRALPALHNIKALDTRWRKVPPRMGEYPTRLKQKTLADIE